LVFGIPELLIIQLILSGNLIINGFQIQIQVQLSRKGAYFTLNWTDFFSQVFGLIFGLISYFLGFGLYALAVQLISTPMLLATSRFFASSWRPLRARNILKSRHLISSSGNYGSGQIISFLNRNVDNFLIGLIWGPKGLGPYSRAYQLQTIPVISALAPLTNVFIPQLVEKKKNGVDVDSLLVRYQIQIALAASFFFCIGATSASNLLPIVLGEQWVSAASIFSIIAFAGIFEALNQATYWRFLVYNESKIFLAYSLISGVFCVTNIAFSAFVGVTAVAYAVVVNQSFNWIVAQLLLRKATNMNIWNSFRVGFFAIFASFTSFELSNLILKQLFVNDSGSLTSTTLSVLMPFLFLVIIFMMSRDFRLELTRFIKVKRLNYG